ncbi:FtsB family cell division protein [Nocardioides jiangxiensis]|uniref:Septum formation initiator family protein n=1 Tax=Nocardioides jiangxiensis TaxID=3064524 RepID=A0ABT9B230_9ACTN|nr:septum formation initiator family protein [Nocardioides sp. WY-20]MDO7868810.1 septum formation initiator family protein [Nocardioides sp. WY-20]
MAAQRRTPARGVNRGQAGPGRGLAAGRTTLRNAAAAAAAGARETPRITSRAVVLLLVLAVLAVSWASSFRAWFQQRAEMDQLRTQITQTQAQIDKLQDEKKRFKDDAYVRQQARLRFGYVMPGEDSLIALDENGQPIGSVEKLADPADAPGTDPVAWYSTVWDSVEAAGNPEEKQQ